MWVCDVKECSFIPQFQWKRLNRKNTVIKKKNCRICLFALNGIGIESIFGWAEDGFKVLNFREGSEVLNVVHRNGWLTENRLISCCLAAFSKTSLEVPFAHFPKIWFIRFFDWWMIYSSTCSSSIHESNCTIFKESFGWFVIVIESSPSNQWKFPFFKLQFHKSKLHRRTHWTDFVMRFTQKKRTFKEYFSAAALSSTHAEWMEIGKIHFDSLAIVIIFGNS